MDNMGDKSWNNLIKLRLGPKRSLVYNVFGFDHNKNWRRNYGSKKVIQKMDIFLDFV